METNVIGGFLRRAGAQVTTWQPEEVDAVLYAASALFAGLTAELSGLSLYRQWGEMAVGPYLVAAVVSALIGRHAARRQAGTVDAAPRQPTGRAHDRRKQWGTARVVLFLFVLLGATLVPLSLEVAWHHNQPEVTVIQQAASRVAKGKDPYHAYVEDNHVVSANPGEPAYESFFPYLPLMTVFGLPSSTHGPIRFTDARIFFSVATLAVAGAALALCQASSERKVRALQVLTVLPTAALPLATGGDDMPIVAFLLLAMVLAQRRRPGLAGVVLGIVSSMKFTAWPLAGLALFAARGRDGRRAPVRMALGMLVVAGPVVAPFLWKNPSVFVENVLLFPLGLAGISSPAASALPGHLLVSAFPWLHHALPVVVGVVGGLVLLRYLVRHTPKTAAEVCVLGGWVMAVAIVLAPATRVGYLLYPVNFFVWGYMLKGAAPLAEPGELGTVVDLASEDPFARDSAVAGRSA